MSDKAPNSKDKGATPSGLPVNDNSPSSIEDTGLDTDDDFLGQLDAGEDGADIDGVDKEPAKPVAANLRKLHQEIGSDGKPVEKHKRNIYISKQTVDSINELAKSRNVTGSKVVEMAIALFYKNYFEREFIQISDLELFVEELSLLVGEQAEEVSHLSELVTRVLDAEMELPTDLD
jgi:hypothetical protein